MAKVIPDNADSRLVDKSLSPAHHLDTLDGPVPDQGDGGNTHSEGNADGSGSSGGDNSEK